MSPEQDQRPPGTTDLLRRIEALERERGTIDVYDEQQLLRGIRNIHFTGAGVAAARTGHRATVTIAGGGGAHAILDGGTAHSDSVVQTVSRGSIIYGNSTPKWDELTLGTSGKVLESDGTDIAWKTPSVTLEREYVWHLASATAGVIVANALGGYQITNNLGLTETVTRIVITTDPTAGTSATIVIELNSSDDLDTVSWATVQSNAVGSGEEGYIKSSAFTDSSLEPNRLLRVNCTAVTGNYYNMTCSLYTTMSQSLTFA